MIVERLLNSALVSQAGKIEGNAGVMSLTDQFYLEIYLAS